MGTQREQGTTLFTAIEHLRLLAKWKLVLGSALLMVLIAVADEFTGPDVACSVGYMIPVFLASVGGRRIGIAFAAVAGSSWTWLDIRSHAGPYADDWIPYWNLFARILVLGFIAVLTAAVTRKLSQEHRNSRTDSLTGLPNARAFHEAAAQELGRMHDTGQVLTAAYVDIDHFKAVNDTLGHAAGDELLIRTARTMATALRGTDVVARLGGDEFALLLPGATSEDAATRLRSLHDALTKAAADVDPPVGFSIGAVTFTDPPPSGAHVLACADRVMYSVKQQGKNTVRTQPADDTAYAEKIP